MPSFCPQEESNHNCVHTLGGSFHLSDVCNEWCICCVLCSWFCSLSSIHFLWMPRVLFNINHPIKLGLPRWFSGKTSSCQCRRCRFNPWVGKIPEVENSNPLQYSCLENPMDRWARQATVHGVTKNQSKLNTHADTNTSELPFVQATVDLLASLTLPIFFSYTCLLRITIFYHLQGSLVLHISLKFILQECLLALGMILQDTVCVLLGDVWRISQTRSIPKKRWADPEHPKSRGWSGAFAPCPRMHLKTLVSPASSSCPHLHWFSSLHCSALFSRVSAPAWQGSRETSSHIDRGVGCA